MLDDLFAPSNNYIHQSTRAHFISLNLYSPSSDLFVAINILVEFMIAGTVNPTYTRIVPFKANVFELSSEKWLQACDIGRLIICFYLGYMIYKKIVSTAAQGD